MTATPPAAPTDPGAPSDPANPADQAEGVTARPWWRRFVLPTAAVVLGVLMVLASNWGSARLLARGSGDLVLDRPAASVKVRLDGAAEQILWGPTNSDAVCEVRDTTTGAGVRVDRVQNPARRTHRDQEQSANFLFEAPASQRVTVRCDQFDATRAQLWSVGPNFGDLESLALRVLRYGGLAVIGLGAAWAAVLGLLVWRRGRAAPGASAAEATEPEAPDHPGTTGASGASGSGDDAPPQHHG